MGDDERFFPRPTWGVLPDRVRQIGFVKNWSPLVWPCSIINDRATELLIDRDDHPPQHLVGTVNVGRQIARVSRHNSTLDA